MNNLDLLILEDSDNDFKSIHQTNIGVFNVKDKSINFKEYRAKNVDEAKNLLQLNKNFVGAVIDLKITNEVADEALGNELIAEIFNTLRIPIFVYSNNLALLDESYLTSKSQFLRPYKKEDKPFLEILKEVKELYSTGIIDILGKRGLIDNFLNKIFWEHFSESIDEWNANGANKEENEKILLRYINEHLKEHLELTKGDLPFDKFVPNEIYIFPPIKPFVFTGSILESGEGGKFYLVLNPACDFANDKADYILISEVSSKASLLKGAINKCKKTSDLDDEDSIKKMARNGLGRLISNSGSPRYYYLPKIKEFSGGLLDFQKIEFLKRKQIDTDFKIIGAISSSFMKDITAKFSYYYSRQGSPDFDWDKIMQGLIKGN